MSAARRVLFVDDEQPILNSLRFVLRRQRGWEMSFATSGEQGLLELAREPADIVVSDMRMPGMDGVAFLTEVKRRYPAATRIVLSGFAEHDAVMRALAVAHQFLAKPWEAADLKAIIERTSDLHQLLAGEALRRTVGKIARLPSAPTVYLQLSAAAARADVGAADVAQILQQDSAMSTKVLQLVNSAFFGAAQRVTSVRRAVTHLGIGLIKSLVLSTEVFGAFPDAGGDLLEDIQRHCVRSSHLALAFMRGRPGADEAFSAALLQDVGKLVLLATEPGHYRALLSSSQSQHRSLFEVEREAFGTTHAEVGAYLLGIWGLPFTIVETVAHHHTPSAVRDGPCEVLAAVHAASELSRTDAEPELNEEFIARAGLADRLPAWRELAKAR